MAATSAVSTSLSLLRTGTKSRSHSGSGSSRLIVGATTPSAKANSAAATPTQAFWATQFDRNRRFARLPLDYDLDQTDNRDAYRRALLAEGRARRNLEAFEDGVRLEVRQAYRSLLQSRRSYELQRRSVVIAIRRTKLARLQQKEGLVPARDVLDAERDRISAVYHNRLERGWRLEADPTVRYAIGRFRRRLYYKDLDVDSPYNTYRYGGLPPGPIANPGKAALQAALYPADCPYAYFVSKNDGSHHFSTTLAEQNRAVRRYQRRGSRAP